MTDPTNEYRAFLGESVMEYYRSLKGGGDMATGHYETEVEEEQIRQAAMPENGGGE